ncbi:MAG: aldo/keto reductase [Clostridia bacterium]|nr:aldo/keto reductase [Clostridia bacterium]
MEFTTLNNGVKMPMLGYGVYQTPPAITEQCVADALKVGYRSIDTAQAYGNEQGVGAAVKKSGIPRGEIFITTKVWITNAGYEKAAASIDQSLEKLQADYVDLLLIHQPFGDYYGTYRAMEQAYKSGKARAIGVSNFYPDRFIDIEHFAEIKPAVNQIETHVFWQQKEAEKYLQARDCRIMSWGPFAEGKNDYFNNAVLKDIGTKYNKTVAQVALRFLLQSGVILIPKTTHIERMKENFDIFNFSLNQTDMEKISALDTGKSLFFSHHDPQTVEWFMSIL